MQYSFSDMAISTSRLNYCELSGKVAADVDAGVAGIACKLDACVLVKADVDAGIAGIACEFDVCVLPDSADIATESLDVVLKDGRPERMQAYYCLDSTEAWR